jgi:DNA-binding transcriptional regulator LsrR (DeoR family)
MLGADDLDLAVAARACRLFYLEERSKSEIAAELGVSRFKVARLIAAAHARGLVRIEVLEPHRDAAALSAQLREGLGLAEAVVVPEASTEAAGLAAAKLLRERLSAGDILGLGWGRAVHGVVQGLGTVRPEGPVDVVQLAGGVPGVEFPLSAIGLAARAAELLGGRLHPLHAPAFVAKRRAWEALLAEPAIASTLAMASRAAVAVIGVGAWPPGPGGATAGSALVLAGALRPRQERELRRAGVCGDVLCHFFDAQGRLLRDVEPLPVAPSVEHLRSIPYRLAVATGAEKAGALRAAARSGMVNAIVTDAATAAIMVGR